MLAKVTFESLVAGKPKCGNCITHGNGCKDPEMEEPFGRGAPAKTLREKVVWIRGRFGRNGNLRWLLRHQGVSNKNKATKLG
jgi:hypothetical protein